VEGRAAHLDDVEVQVGLTFEVVEALLSAQGLGFTDVTRAIAYVTRREFATVVERRAAAMPAVVTRCGTCRADLAFEVEVEVDAVASRLR